ncbi:hypothetical protein AB0D32_07435 [Micromonospora sp. NPDC048170]|uniref:hypothetical protein n=1 Tax=Micromonospora sp. NPDC048170 TaxID=3154819 RepID=UPI0033D66492
MKAHRMDQETVERMLGEPVVGPHGGPRPIASLLTALRAAPRSGELAGEEAAVRAYRLARAGSTAVLPGCRRPALARFGVRAALVGAALTLTGGAALAATGGTLPHPLRRPADATAAPAPAPTVPAPTVGTSPTVTPDPPSTSGGPDGRATPEAAVRQWCRAYRADVGDRPGRFPHDAAYGGLVHAAGGRKEVPGYCERVLADEPRSPRPHDEPSRRPGTRPTGRPAAEPTVRRSGQPTVSPSATTARPSPPGPSHVAPAHGRPTAVPAGGDAG